MPDEAPSSNGEESLVDKGRRQLRQLVVGLVLFYALAAWQAYAGDFNLFAILGGLLAAGAITVAFARGHTWARLTAMALFALAAVAALITALAKPEVMWLFLVVTAILGGYAVYISRSRALNHYLEAKAAARTEAPAAARPKPGSEEERDIWDVQQEKARGGGLRAVDVMELVVYFAAAPGLYGLAIWLAGYWPGVDVGWGWHIGGAFLASIVSIFLSFMGESFIEDVVKFAMLLVYVGIAFAWLSAPFQALAIAAACGSGCPLLFRAAIK